MKWVLWKVLANGRAYRKRSNHIQAALKVCRLSELPTSSCNLQAKREHKVKWNESDVEFRWIKCQVLHHWQRGCNDQAGDRAGYETFGSLRVPKLCHFGRSLTTGKWAKLAVLHCLSWRSWYGEKREFSQFIVCASHCLLLKNLSPWSECFNVEGCL